MLEIMMFWRSQ